MKLLRALRIIAGCGLITVIVMTARSTGRSNFATGFLCVVVGVYTLFPSSKPKI